MTLGPSMSGVSVHADPSLPEFKETHRQERKWAHRVMWNRHQRFTVFQRLLVVKTGGKLFAHPNTVERLKGMTIVGLGAL